MVDVRRRKEDMTGGSHKEVIYLDVNWADRPPLPSGPSAVFLGVTPAIHVLPCQQQRLFPRRWIKQQQQRRSPLPTTVSF